MIKNILFDLGGVFIELTREVAVERLVALGIRDADELLDPFKQEGIFLALESGQYDREEFTKKVNELYSLSLVPEQIEHALLGFVSKIQEWKFDFLEEELPSHLRLLLVSNTNPFIWEKGESGDLLSNGRSFSSYFDHVTTSYQAGVCKPEPEIFEQILRETGILPEETLFVDDGPDNTRVARDLGFVTYCPENGEDWRPVLRKMMGTK